MLALSVNVFARFHHFFLGLLLFVFVGMQIQTEVLSSDLSQSKVVHSTEPSHRFRSEGEIFHISESELESLVQNLATKVNLFEDIWRKDPGAEFFGGTTRDFIYWILGHFRNAQSQTEVDRIKAELLQLPFIDIRKILHSESDIDILTREPSKLSDVDAIHYGVRKIDDVSFDRFNLETEIGKNEIDQGSLPIEKIRLTKSGIVRSNSFGNGLGEILSGHISILIPDPEKYKATQYVKNGLNHPVLLALRYIRCLAQDYLHRFGNDFHSIERQKRLLDLKSMQWVASVISTAAIDPDFQLLLKNDQATKWLSASIRKAFRGFSNPTAAFHWFQFFKVDQLQRAFPNEIPSLHDYLLIRNWNEEGIQKNWSEFRDEVSEASVVIRPESVFEDGYIYHGAGSSEAFRSLIFQGAVPSASGNAGRGFYGVPISQLKTAEMFAEKGGDPKRIVKSKISSGARIVDIRKDEGMRLFHAWLGKKGYDFRINSEILDLFAEAFGFDIILYDYNPLAAVVKNRRALGRFEGVYYQLMPIDEILVLAKKVYSSDDLIHIFEIFNFNNLNAQEVARIVSQVDKSRWTPLVQSDEIQRWISASDSSMFKFLMVASSYLFDSSDSRLWKSFFKKKLEFVVKKLEGFAASQKQELDELLVKLKMLISAITDRHQYFSSDRRYARSIYSLVDRLSHWAMKEPGQLKLSLSLGFLRDLSSAANAVNSEWVSRFDLDPVVAIEELEALLGARIDKSSHDDSADLQSTFVSFYFSPPAIEYTLQKMQPWFVRQGESILRSDLSLSISKKIDQFNLFFPERKTAFPNLLARLRLATHISNQQLVHRIDAIQFLISRESKTMFSYQGLGSLWFTVESVLDKQLGDSRNSLDPELIALVSSWLLDPAMLFDSKRNYDFTVNLNIPVGQIVFNILSEKEILEIWHKVKTSHFAQRFYATYVMRKNSWIRDHWNEIIELAETHKVDRELTQILEDISLPTEKREQLVRILESVSVSHLSFFKDWNQREKAFRAHWNALMDEIKSNSTRTYSAEFPGHHLSSSASLDEVIQFIINKAKWGYSFSEGDKALVIGLLRATEFSPDVFEKLLDERLKDIVESAVDPESVYQFLLSLPWDEIVGRVYFPAFLNRQPLPRGALDESNKSMTAGALGIELVELQDMELLPRAENLYRSRPALFRVERLQPWSILRSKTKFSLKGPFRRSHIYFEVDPRAREGIDFRILNRGINTETIVVWLTTWALSKEISLRDEVVKKFSFLVDDPGFAPFLVQDWPYLFSEMYSDSFPRYVVGWDLDKLIAAPIEKLISYGTVDRELVLLISNNETLWGFPHLFERLVRAGKADYEIDLVLRNNWNFRDRFPYFLKKKVNLSNLRELFESGFTFEKIRSSNSGDGCVDLLGKSLKQNSLGGPVYPPRD